MSPAGSGNRCTESVPKAKPKPLTDDERRRILEEIARNPSNRSAQIQALRFLKELDNDGEQPTAEGFAALDD